MEQRFHKVRGRTLEEAYRRLRAEHGPDAVVLRTAEVNEGGLFGYFGRRMIEVTAAVPAAAGLPPARKPTLAERRYAQQQGSTPAETPSERDHIAKLERVIREAQQRINAAPVPAASAPAPPAPLPSALPAARGASPAPMLAFPPRAEAATAEGEHVRRELRDLREMVQVLYAENPGAGLPAEFAPHYRALVERGVSRALAGELLQAVLRDADVDMLRDGRVFRERLKLEIRRRIPVTGGLALAGGDRRVIALCGPTGVGKTTNLAKLAAHYAVRERARVGLITADTYRIAATEQLRVYANIIGVPLHVAQDAREAHRALEALAECDIVLADTAGGSPYNLEQIGELKAMLAALRPHETTLVVAANTPLDDLRNIVNNFKCCAPGSVLFTKLDETRRYGGMLSLLAEAQLPLGYLSVGQNVPDDLRIARPATLANLVVEGKDTHHE